MIKKICRLPSTKTAKTSDSLTYTSCYRPWGTWSKPVTLRLVAVRPLKATRTPNPILMHGAGGAQIFAVETGTIFLTHSNRATQQIEAVIQARGHCFRDLCRFGWRGGTFQSLAPLLAEALQAWLFTPQEASDSTEVRHGFMYSCTATQIVHLTTTSSSESRVESRPGQGESELHAAATDSSWLPGPLAQYVQHGLSSACEEEQ